MLTVYNRYVVIYLRERLQIILDTISRYGYFNNMLFFIKSFGYGVTQRLHNTKNKNH